MNYRKIVAVLLAIGMVFRLAGCQSGEKEQETEIQVFIAASLHTVMEELAEKYQETHPDVKITFHADSSGTLLTQIQEGYECDLFFSAAQKQMDALEEAGLVVDLSLIHI